MGEHRSLMLALFQLHAYLIRAHEAAQCSVRALRLLAKRAGRLSTSSLRRTKDDPQWQRCRQTLQVKYDSRCVAKPITEFSRPYGAGRTGCVSILSVTRLMRRALCR